MKYSTEITINLPRDRVIELFDDPDNLSKWQPGLKSFEHLSGEAGLPGAKSKLVYDMNGRRIEMIETIIRRNLPDEFSGTYEAKGVWNEVANYFYDEGGKTRWVTEHEFKLSGLMALFGIFMGGSFKKQSQKTMDDFKAFAEKSG